MPVMALKAHFDGRAVVLDEPCDLPAETPLLVVVNPYSTGEPAAPNRVAAFRDIWGSMRGRISTTDEFIDRKVEEKALEDARLR